MKKMKIGVWILTEYSPQLGGGFSLYDKFIKLIDAYSFSEEIEVCFVGLKPASNLDFHRDYICLDIISNTFSFLQNPAIASNPLISLFLKYNHYAIRKISILRNRIHALLEKNEIDLIYYPVQGVKLIDEFPFIVSNWDIGHRSTYAFPELTKRKEFRYRQNWYLQELHKAFTVFVESEAGKEELVRYTNCNPDHIAVVPLFPGGVVDMNVSEKEQFQLLAEMDLVPQKFFFYPAQFWAHKNHYNLLHAFQEFLVEFPDIKLILPGSDQGNKKYILEVAASLGLSQYVYFSGFISNELLYTLYKNALALVMPTFLGPTNMPLLEARALNCPVLCSDLPGHRAMMQDGALYFDPHSLHAIRDAMKMVMKTSKREALLVHAGQTLRDTRFSSDAALISLDTHFVRLKAVRQTWGKHCN